MTRRPPMPPDGNIRRAHQRMAPGGRLWSESPVRGPAVRVVAAGDDPPTPPDPPVEPVVEVWTVSDAPFFDSGDYWMSQFQTIAAGQEAAFAAFGINCGWVAPPGWTVLRQGRVGTLDYMAASRVFTGSDNLTVGTALGDGWQYTADGTGLGRIHLVAFSGQEGTMTATAPTPALGATSIDLVQPQSMSGVWQVAAGTRNPQGGGGPAAWVPDIGAGFNAIGERTNPTLDPLIPAGMFSGCVYPQLAPVAAAATFDGDTFDGVAFTIGYMA